MRRITRDDLPWLHRVFRQRYDSHYDAMGAEGWLTETVLPNPALFYPVRNEHAFLIALLSVSPWLPADWSCFIVVVCAEPGHVWSALPRLRSSMEWARNRRARWRFNSDTENDIGPLMRRIGATEIEPRYSKEFSHG